MELQFPRLEVSRASSEYKLLADLRQGTSEYILVRGADLSFDDAPIAAYHHRSYRRWYDTICALPRYDHYIGHCHDALAGFYEALGLSYQALAYQLDPSMPAQELYDPYVLLQDLQFVQTVNLPLSVFQYAPKEVTEMFQEKASLKEYEAKMQKVWAIIDMMPRVVDNPRKGEIFFNQLQHLYSFYGNVRELLSQYQQAFSMPVLENPLIAADGQAAQYYQQQPMSAHGANGQAAPVTSIDQHNHDAPTGASQPTLLSLSG